MEKYNTIILWINIWSDTTMKNSKIKYIDCYTHIAKSLENKRYFNDASLAALLKHMKNYNIRYSFVHARYTNSKNDISNEEIATIVQKYSPYLIGVGAININDFKNTFFSAKTNCLNGLFRAIKLYPIYQNIKLNHPDFKKVYSFCQGHMIPLIFRVGSSKASSSKIQPKELEEVLFNYPRLIIVIAHFGMPYVKQTLELISKNKDKLIYVDISGIEHKNDIRFLTNLINYYKKNNLPINRVLFGSNFPFSRTDLAINRIRESVLSPNEKTGIFYGNSKKLFKITREYKKKNFQNKIKELCVIPLYKCNRKCAFCFVNNRQKDDKYMTLKFFKKIVEKAKKEKIPKIVMFGGEPTLWPYLSEAISFVKEHNMKIQLYTNGTISIKSFSRPDEIHLNLNTCLSQIKQEIESLVKGGVILKGELIISKNIEIAEIQKILKDTNKYSSITLSLDVTEIDKKQQVENFNKIVRFKDQDKVRINLYAPSCQLTQEQNFIARTALNITEENCFPEWEDLVIDNQLNIRSCIGSNAKIKFNDKILFSEYHGLLFEKVKKEIDKLPSKKCEDCYYFKAKFCTGGCIIWKNIIEHKKEV